MKPRLKKHVLPFLLALSISLVFSACPGKSTDDNAGALLALAALGQPTAPVTTYGGTTSPGDAIEWTIDRQNLTFQMANLDATNAVTISGTVEIFPTGFLKLTVIASSDALKVPVGGQAYALEVPGLVLFVHPIGGTSSNHTMALVAKGDCSISGTYNMVRIGYSASTTAANMDYAIVALTESGGTFSVAGNVYDFSDTITGGPLTGSGTCDAGKVQVDANITGYSSAAGGIALDLGPGQGGIIGFRQAALSAGAGTKNFAGIAFTYGGSGTDDATTPITVSCTNFNCTGAPLANVETGEVAAGQSATVGFTFNNLGLGNGSFSAGSGAVVLKAAAYELGGVTVVYFTGWDANANGGLGAPFGALMVSR